MAAVSIPPSSHAVGGVMATHRVALVENPNLGNSPYHRAVVTPVKRTRSYGNGGENTPPNKRQALEEKLAPRTPTRKVAPARIEKRLQGERQITGRAIKQDRGETATQPLETVLQWQRHYRKMFPGYVFYFENIPEETRRRCVKGIESLGAREVKFFSKDVTHIITTRSMPSEEESGQRAGANVADTDAADQENDHPRTINPSLLAKGAETLSEVPKGKFNFDLASIKKGATPLLDLNARQPAANKVDILQKAKELGIKVWQLEKLWRVLRTIFDNSQSNESHNTRSNAAVQSKTVKQVDLSQMIKNEQIHERGDREINAGTAELVKLSGPYLYVRDMNEKTKPILVREYPKVDRKEDGEWPQFRSASSGKCPFVEEDVQNKKTKENREEKARRAAEAKAKALATAQVRTTRTTMQPPTIRARREPLVESTSAANSARQPYQLPPPPSKNDSTFTNGKDARINVPGTRLIGGEPVASGVQPSNITSAIRSQMISSTAAGPGARAGTSKEIHDLQRKALERNTHGLRQSQRMTDIAGTYGRAAMARAARKEPTMIKEDQEDDSQTRSRTLEKPKSHAPVREEKAGYCENCKEKFPDFEEHTHSRKHKKFAIDANNWRELDQLLSKLIRPLKSEMDYYDEDEE